ncbi:MAG: signal recognition particle-docking protein FtsY [Spirochaetales bacterium]
MGFLKNLINGLRRTKDALASKIESIFTGGELNDEFYEELEYVLIGSDIAASTTDEIIEDLKNTAKTEKLKTAEDVKSALRKVLINILEKVEIEAFEYPLAILVVGVNGVGKTTTLGKLANYFKEEKKEVLLVAGDTFRAAASDQLSEWAKRVNVKIVKHKEGADPSAVVYDGIASAKAKDTDVVLIDTAGRLHNKVGLMEELKKIARTVEKNYEEANFKKYLVIDATTGQNAISQVKYFDEAVGIDGIILTKLDGTAKGGIVLTIMNELNIPVTFIGVGEKLDDLQPFSAVDFVTSII